jgi:hypothetical protein
VTILGDHYFMVNAQSIGCPRWMRPAGTSHAGDHERQPVIELDAGETTYNGLNGLNGFRRRVPPLPNPFNPFNPL